MMMTSRRMLLAAGAVGSAALASGLFAQAATQGDQAGPAGPAKPDGPVLRTFLMFTGNAEEAMKLYASVFENSRIVEITRYGKNEPGKEGSVRKAVFSLNGQELIFIDSPIQHAFTFTPAMSLFVTSADEAAVARYFEALSKGGKVLMPLDKYDFSPKFAWIEDRFGVSWQLSVR